MDKQGEDVSTHSKQRGSSDTVGGQTLATNIFQSILLNAATNGFTSYSAVLTAAKNDWVAP
jgi:hypothetical protein